MHSSCLRLDFSSPFIELCLDFNITTLYAIVNTLNSKVAYSLLLISVKRQLFYRQYDIIDSFLSLERQILTVPLLFVSHF